MTTTFHHMVRSSGENLIATFGSARLVTRSDGKVILCGGSASDLAEAREWVSLFLHEAVPLVAAGN